MTRLPITPVQPIGRSRHRVFGRCADGSAFYEIELDDYPDSIDSRGFRESRKARFGLREAARRLGLTATELSGLEHGAYTCDWGLALKMLDEGGAA